MSPNIDHDEIDKFSDLAKDWWDPKGPMKPLHELNPLRLSFIEKHAKLNGKTVIDIGCGGGILTESMATLNANVTGIDMSEEALLVAKAHQKKQGLEIDYQLITAESIAEKHPHHFDVVTCLELLEHVPDPHSVIAAAAQLVKPGGHVFFSTLNRTLKAYLFAIIGAEYVLNMLPKGTHDYAKFIRPSELRAGCEKNHLKFSALSGMSYNLLARQFELSDDVSVNYLVHCQPLKGEMP